MKGESIQNKVEAWAKNNRGLVIGPKAKITVAAKYCSQDLNIRVSTADKYLRDLKVGWNEKYGPDKIIPQTNTMEDLKFDSDFKVEEDLEKAYKESDIVERVEKKFPKKDLKEVKLDYEKYEEDMKKMEKIIGETPIISLESLQLLDSLCISHITCFGSVGKIDISPYGVYQQVPRYKGENGEYIPVDSIIFRTPEDLQKYYDEIKKCFEIREFLNLKNPEKKER